MGGPGTASVFRRDQGGYRGLGQDTNIHPGPVFGVKSATIAEEIINRWYYGDPLETNKK